MNNLDDVIVWWETNQERARGLRRLIIQASHRTDWNAVIEGDADYLLNWLQVRYGSAIQWFRELVKQNVARAVQPVPHLLSYSLHVCYGVELGTFHRHQTFFNGIHFTYELSYFFELSINQIKASIHGLQENFEGRFGLGCRWHWRRWRGFPAALGGSVLKEPSGSGPALVEHELWK